MNCKCLQNNKKLIEKVIKENDITFLTETWIGEWDPGVLCDIKMMKIHVWTTSRRRQSQRKGRQSCMSAFVVNDIFDKAIKLEFVNKRISVLKLKTVNDNS